MSLIHPAIIEELSRKNFGLAHQTKMCNIFDRQTDRRTKKKRANLGTLRSIFWKFEVIPSSSLGGDVQTRFWAAPYGPCLTDCVRSKFLSDIKLGTQRNNSWKLELNTSSHYRVVVLTIFFGHNLLAVPYWPCTVKIFIRCKTRDLKKHFLKSWA